MFPPSPSPLPLFFFPPQLCSGPIASSLQLPANTRVGEENSSPVSHALSGGLGGAWWGGRNYVMTSQGQLFSLFTCPFWTGLLDVRSKERNIGLILFPLLTRGLIFPRDLLPSVTLLLPFSSLQTLQLHLKRTLAITGPKLLETQLRKMRVCMGFLL